MTKTTEKLHELLISEGFSIDGAGQDSHERDVVSYKKGNEEIIIVDNYDQAISKKYRDFKTVKENVTAGSVYDPKIEETTFDLIKKVTLK